MILWLISGNMKNSIEDESTGVAEELFTDYRSNLQVRDMKHKVRICTK